jgi:hypothetical protein
MNVPKPILNKVLVGIKLVGVLLLIFILLYNSTLAHAQTAPFSQDDLNSIIGETPFYDPSATQCNSATATGTSVGTTTTPTGAGAWTSNLQPPYYLEEFAVQVLEDIAAIKGVPQSDTVTQEHVIALVGWFWAEGGDINNSDLFNPLNTSQLEPGSTTQSTGNQAYPNFDTGVQATAVTMTSSLQTRIGQILTTPASTAEQVMYAVSYFQNYPGNKAWAAADSPGAAQQTYYNDLITSVEQARKDYSTEAATILGTLAKEELLNERVPASELQYNGGVSAGIPGSSGSSDSGCASSTTSCTSGAGGGTTSDLSQTRQDVVCIAQAQLTLWETQPDYKTANFPYAAKGFLDYSNQVYEEWCADFASWVYDQAKYPLNPDPNWITPGVSTIETIGKANQNFHWHPESSGYVPQPGDLAIHSTSGNPDYHVNIFISSTNNVSTYIGGDQGDYGPYGAPSPTKIPPATPSESIVSTETGTGYYDNDIIGYVSPD